MSATPNTFDNLLPKIPLLENFKIIEKLGQGSFGSIYSAYLHKFTSKSKNFPSQYAVKIETFDPTNSISLSNRTLSREAKFLYMLKETLGFPRIFYCSTFQDRTILIMERLGENLEMVFNRLERIFTLQTVVLIADQTLTRLAALSEKGIVHRDLKPDNFLLDMKKQNVIYLLDFGLSKKFLTDMNDHIVLQKGVGLVGTPRYTSMNSHLGFQQSRRDDLESLGYILVYFLKGKLPWMNINYQNKANMLSSEQKNLLILKKKQETSLEQLCENLPVEFLEYFKYVKELNFNEIPDYQMLIKKFKKLFKDPEQNLTFDWENNKINTKKLSEPNIPLNRQKMAQSNNNSENMEKIKISMKNLVNAEMLWKYSGKKTSRMPKKSKFNGENIQEKSSFEDKMNANFLNDVSIQDEELNTINQNAISRKIIFQPLRNVRSKNCLGKEEESMENLDDEEEMKQNLGCLMKYLELQKKPRTLNFHSRIMN